jgi:hypothetical protein
MFPKTLANNIAFMFTNVLGDLSLNFPVERAPELLKDAPQFLVNNPIALQKKYLMFKDDPDMKSRMAGFRKAVKTDEQGALETLAGFFDWLDGLEQQSTTGIVPLFEARQNIIAKGPRDTKKEQSRKLEPLRNAIVIVQEGVQKVKRIFVDE